MERWDEGVFVFQGRQARGATPLILSAGVHGDETAPVKVLEILLQQIQQGSLVPARPLLVIFANTAALLNGRRFMKTNMNRLFGAPLRPCGAEADRALELEGHCQEFSALHGSGWHLDLHSTIKPSRHVCFALKPADHRPYEQHWSPLLAQCGFTALVTQHSQACTFANFTSRTLGFESFTLETGAVQASSSDVPAVLQSLLTPLLQADPFARTGGKTLQQYQVVIDLIKHSESFRFCVDEQADNFIPYSKDTLLAKDGTEKIHAPADNCALLFANSRVPVGDRAALVLAPV